MDHAPRRGRHHRPAHLLHQRRPTTAALHCRLAAVQRPDRATYFVGHILRRNIHPAQVRRVRVDLDRHRRVHTRPGGDPPRETGVHGYRDAGIDLVPPAAGYLM